MHTLGRCMEWSGARRPLTAVSCLSVFVFIEMIRALPGVGGQLDSASLESLAFTVSSVISDTAAARVVRGPPQGQRPLKAGKGESGNLRASPALNHILYTESPVSQSVLQPLAGARTALDLLVEHERIAISAQAESVLPPMKVPSSVRIAITDGGDDRRLQTGAELSLVNEPNSEAPCDNRIDGMNANDRQVFDGQLHGTSTVPSRALQRLPSRLAIRFC